MIVIYKKKFKINRNKKVLFKRKQRRFKMSYRAKFNNWNKMNRFIFNKRIYFKIKLMFFLEKLSLQNKKKIKKQFILKNELKNWKFRTSENLN